MPEVSEILERAVEIIDERGLCQSEAGGKAETGEVCSLIATSLALEEIQWNWYNSEELSKKWETAKYLLYANVPEVFIEHDRYSVMSVTGGTVARFNDDPSTSEEDVRLMFKKAIADSREREK